MDLSRLINILQTILTIIITVVPTLVLSLGCTGDPAGTIECSQALISPELLGWLIGVVGFIKTVVLPWLAPGGWVRNLFGARAAVVPSTSGQATPGTVAPQDVR